MTLSSLSPKTKAMIPIFSFFLLFFLFLAFLRHYEITKTMVHDEYEFAFRLANAYVQAEETTLNFFKHRGFSCLNSIAIKEALRAKDIQSIQKLAQSSWNELSVENRFLKDIRFYDADFQPLCSFQNHSFEKKIVSEIMQGEVYGTFIVKKNIFTYNIFVPSMCNGHFLGMVEFVIDVEHFLNFMKHTLDIETTLFVNTDLYGIRSDDFAKICNFQLYLSTLPTHLQHSEIFKDLSACDNDILHLGERLFSAHIFYVLNKEGQNLARFVFLYELTKHKEKIVFWIKRATVITLIFIILSYIVLNVEFNFLISRLKKSENMLVQVNKTLEERIEKEISHRMAKEEESREKERMIVHQDRLASMGEMIGNIAHQWRQPLTELGSLFIRLEVCFEKNILTNEELKKITHKSNNLIQFMSQTIDDFRYFFSTDISKTLFCLNDAFEQAFHLVGAALKNNHIEVIIEHKDKLYIQAIQSEFSHAVLNILNNAKDVLVERSIKNPQIHVSFFIKDGLQIVQIKDNGGGIAFEPIDKIFEPYISSKHASSGTGIGLYMAKNIIEKNQKGKLIAYNEANHAVFQIIFKHN